MIWFHGTYGRYALTESSGTFLYSRVSTFAECDKINPSADVRALCDPTPPYLRPVSGEYLWADNEKWPDNHVTTPLYNLYHSADNSLRFTPKVNGMAEKFAREAILAQPVSYLHVVARRHAAHLRLEPAARPAQLLRERPGLPVRLRQDPERADPLVGEPVPG